MTDKQRIEVIKTGGMNCKASALFRVGPDSDSRNSIGAKDLHPFASGFTGRGGAGPLLWSFVLILVSTKAVQAMNGY